MKLTTVAAVSASPNGNDGVDVIASNSPEVQFCSGNATTATNKGDFPFVKDQGTATSVLIMAPSAAAVKDIDAFITKVPKAKIHTMVAAANYLASAKSRVRFVPHAFLHLRESKIPLEEPVVIDTVLS